MRETTILSGTVALRQTGSALQQPDKLKEATQEFETQFVTILLQSMRRALPEASPTAPGRGERLFREMLDEQWARGGAQSGGFGLGDMLHRQLSVESAEQ